jgi:lipoteichoic acid synthase
LLWLLALAGSVVVVADLIYFRYFGDIASAAALTAAGEGTYVGESIAGLVSGRDIALVLSIAAAIPLMWEASRLHGASVLSRRGVIGRAVAAAVMAAVAATLAAVELSRAPEVEGVPEQGYSNLAVVRSVGPFGYHLHDAWRYTRSRWQRAPLAPAEHEEVRAWFAGRAPVRAGAGPLFGAARTKNLVLVQAEALQAFVVGLRINGQEVTPNLNLLAREGLNVSNVWDQTSEGRTSDAGFMAFTSLLPLEHGAAVYRHAGNRFVALPQVLAGQGYTTLAAVPFPKDFWNRRAMYSAYGFGRSVFIDDFTPGEIIGWGLNDREFLQQMVPVLADVRRTGRRGTGRRHDGGRDRRPRRRV